MDVTLRALEDADLDRLFEWERDPQAVAMAAFTRADPSDRAAFDEHHRRVRARPDARLWAVDDVAGAFVGTISTFVVDGEREVSYWIDPSRWGQGLGSAAVAAVLRVEPERPLSARVAEHNTRSAATLERAGFVRVGSEVSYAAGVRRDVVEHVYRLDA